MQRPDPPRGPGAPGGDVVLAPSPNWHAAHVLSWAPDGTALAVAAHQSVLLVWPGGGGSSKDCGGGAPGDPHAASTSNGGPHHHPPPPPGPTRQVVLGAHAGRVTAVACMPGDGGGGGGGDAPSRPPAPPPRLLVASAGTDRAVRLWDVATRRCAASASKLKAEPVALAWVGGGGGLVVGLADGGLAAWRPAAARHANSGPPPSVSSSSRPAAVPGWDGALAGRGGVTALASDPAAAGGPGRLAVGCGDGSVWLVCLGCAGGSGDAPPPPVRLWAHGAGPVQGLAWACVGTEAGGPSSALASGGGDGAVLAAAVAAGPESAAPPAPTTHMPPPPPPPAAGGSAAAAGQARRQWTAVAWVATPSSGTWLVASAGPGGGVAAWPAGDALKGGGPSQPPRPPTLLPAGHARVVFGLAPCPALSSAPYALASASMDRTLRFWRAAAPGRGKRGEGSGGGGGGSGGGGGGGGSGGRGPPFRPSAVLPGLGGHAFALALLRARRRGEPPTAAVASGDGSVRVWAVVGRDGGPPSPGAAGPLWRGVPAARPTALAWWAGGDGGDDATPVLAVGGADGGVGLLDPSAGGVCVALPGGRGGGGRGSPAAAPVAALAWLPTSAPPALLALHADGRLVRWGGDAVGATAAAAAAGSRKASGRGSGAIAAPPTPAAATTRGPADFPGGVSAAWAALLRDGGDAPSCLAVATWRGGEEEGGGAVVGLALGGRAGGVHTATTAAAAASQPWSAPAAGTPHAAAVTALAWRDGGDGGARPWLASVAEDGALAARPPPPESASSPPAAAILPGDGRPLTAVAWSCSDDAAGASPSHHPLLRLAAGRADGSLLIARVVRVAPSAPVAQWAVQPTQTLARHGGPVRGLVWVGSEALLTAADDHSVRLWAVAAADREEGEGEEEEARPRTAPPQSRAPTAPAPARSRGGGGGAAAAAIPATFALGPAPLAPPLPPPDPAADGAELAALAAAWGLRGGGSGGGAGGEGGPAPPPPPPPPTGRLGVHATTAAGAAALLAAADEEEAAGGGAPPPPPAAVATAARRAAALRVWAGDAAGAVRTLLGGGSPTAPALDAHAVALAAAVGRGAWESAARAYGAALAAAGDAAGAATYLVAAGDVPGAVRVLARGGRPADAAALAAARLPHGHPARSALAAAVAALAEAAGEGARAAAARMDAGDD